MSILFLVICILAPILLYEIEPSFLFYLSITNTILYLVTILAILNIIALSAIKKHKARVEEAYQQGATVEEREFILNDDIKISEKDNQVVPKWLYVINLVTVMLAIIFLVAGLFYRTS
ncbi:hypothetical protein MHB65_03050 [Lysinibacillus sp. FSL K6-0075]|uniref:hypothetical protein n=1 Tax=Lysinibacillus sp. FSL K6-0075 TaxID=2921415 RepID=UPI0031592389